MNFESRPEEVSSLFLDPYLAPFFVSRTFFFLFRVEEAPR